MSYDLFTEIFKGRGPSTYAGLDAWKSWIAKLWSDENAARDEAQILVDWYHRDRFAIIERLQAVAAKTFGSETADWQFPLINGVPRIISRVSTMYKTAPVRTYARGGEEAGEADLEKIGRMYRGLDQDRKMREVDNWSTLLNTMHVEIVLRDGRIDWDMLLRPAVSVIESPDNYLDFARIVYKFEPIEPESRALVKGWIVWDSETYAFVTEGGEVFGVVDESTDNPYGGVVPIVTVRKVEQNDYWGRYGADLVDGFEQANVQLGNLWENSFFQTHGQPFGINLGLQKGERIKTGCKEFIHVGGVTKDDVEPALKFPKPDADIPEVMELVDWYISKIATNYGLPPGAWSMTEIPESGFAKFLSNAELIEKREEMKPVFAKAERELFEKSRTVWNKWAGSLGEAEIPEDLELQIEFPPISFPESPAEKYQRYLVMFKSGLSSPIDYFMHEEGLTEEQAIEKSKRIAEQNRLVASQGVAAPSLIPPVTEEGKG